MASQMLITPSVPTLLPTDSGSRALDLMEENNLEHIPVVADEKYLALVQEGDILNWDTPDEELRKSDFLRYSPAINANRHPYDAIKIANDQNLSIVPVVDNENHYLGAITRETIIKYLAENTGMDNPGGIVVLEINMKDYSLYEVARICESEEVVILSTQLYTNKSTGKVELTIKTNRASVDSLANTLERFGYVVKEVYGQHANKDDMMDRYNLLMAYINM